MKRLFLPAILLIAVLLIASCGGVTDSTTTPTTATTTTAIPGPPSLEELAVQDFVLPELPRITAEQLKQMMDNGEPLILVDTRLDFFFDMGCLPQSINMPFEPEEEQTASLLALPKDVPIIFYCD